MSAIFYHDEEQERLAVAARNREAARRGGLTHVEILPASKFYRAEDYHQKYYLRMRPELIKALKSIFASDDDFVDSRIAARLNAFLAGYGSLADIEEEISRSGLSTVKSERIVNSLGALVR
jgi:peptide-methionine (S)-S-oxide reductase